MSAPNAVLPSPEGPREETTGCLPVIVRLTWLLFGNIGLVLCAVQVAQGKASLAMDVAFFGVALALVALRYVDVVLFKGHTADGAPATLAHWRRYALILGVASLALWGLARLSAARGWL